MLHRLAIRDFVIVDALEIEFAPGLSVLSGETGAGKSILVDALQLALGSRGDAGVVREGATRAEISAEFDAPAALAAWLAEAGFDADTGDAGRLLLRRTIDAQGKSRAWINGSAATIAQLREAAELLVDIHGQHAWQSLTRAALGARAARRLRPARRRAAGRAWSAWRAATQALAAAREKQGDLERERERLAWQIGEVDKLAPGADEWTELDAEHTRLAHAQSLIDAARLALDAIDQAEANADALAGRALDALQDVAASTLASTGRSRRSPARRRSCRTRRTRSPATSTAPSSIPSGCASSTSGCRPGSAWRAATAGRRPSCRRCWRSGRTSWPRSTPPPTSTRSSARATPRAPPTTARRAASRPRAAPRRRSSPRR